MTAAEDRSNVSRADKEEALAKLLNSVSLGRSEQLRHLLRYVCIEEIEGRGTALTEYAIGVHALGRPAEYSPETDSTVRTRAHELRKRLDDFYRSEGVSAPVRVDLPKGAYRPRFLRTDPALTPAPAPHPVAPAPARKQRDVLLFALAFIIVGICAVFFIGRQTSPSPVEAAVKGVWGPLLDTANPTTIAVATPPQLWVRGLNGEGPPLHDPPFALPAPDTAQFREWYERTDRTAAKGLFLHPNGNSPLWGEAAAAVAATRFLTSRGVRTELLPERAVRPAALKSRNTIVLGRPEYSAAARALQPEGGFSVRYIPERREMGIVDQAGGEGYFRESGGATNYGLITIAAAPSSSGEQRRTIVCSGINSDGSHAGMEFLTSPEHLQALASHMRIGPRDRWPEAFQIVVRTHSTDTFVLRAEYVSHRVLTPHR